MHLLPCAFLHLLTLVSPQSTTQVLQASLNTMLFHTASTSGECLCYSAWNTAQGFTGCAELFYMLIWFSFANTKNSLD